MSTIQSCWVADGSSSALSVGMARYRTEKSIETRKTGSVRTASPIHARRSGRRTAASDPGFLGWSMMLTSLLLFLTYWVQRTHMSTLYAKPLFRDNRPRAGQ